MSTKAAYNRGLYVRVKLIKLAQMFSPSRAESVGVRVIDPDPPLEFAMSDAC